MARVRISDTHSRHMHLLPSNHRAHLFKRFKTSRFRKNISSVVSSQTNRTQRRLTSEEGGQFVAQNVELGPTRLAVRNGMLLDPSAAGEFEKVLTRVRCRVHGLKQVRSCQHALSCGAHGLLLPPTCTSFISMKNSNQKPPTDGVDWPNLSLRTTSVRSLKALW